MIIHTKQNLLTDRFTSNFGHLISDMLNENSSDNSIRPQLELEENEKNYLLKVSLPGLAKEEINLSIEDHILTVSGELTKPTPKNSTSLYSDIKYGKYYRKIRLPKGADSSKVEAVYNLGILHLTITKNETVQPKKIEIK
jgi:HSP20 family protein|tara:strand:- start:6625 stop:7044 length:420 start_codon:yes stop_codon:yes gene_type:complete